MGNTLHRPIRIQLTNNAIGNVRIRRENNKKKDVYVEFLTGELKT